MSTSITKTFEFEAAHHLPNYDGACKNLHGHTYKMEVEVSGYIDEKTGMLIDFSVLKKHVKTIVIDKYDHSNLNDYFDMPTAENMVKDIFDELKKVIDILDVRITRVRLWETSTSYAETKSE